MSLKEIEEAQAQARDICRRMLNYLHQCQAPLQQRERFNRRPCTYPIQQVVEAALHDEVMDEMTAAFLIKTLAKSDPQFALATFDWICQQPGPLASSQQVIDAALVTAAITNFKPEAALSIYDRRHAAGLPPSLQAANMALVACSHSGEADKAVEVLENMQKTGITPNEFSVTMVLQAANYKRRGLYKVAIQAVKALPESSPQSSDVADALLGVFESAMAKATSVDDAEGIFKELESLGLADATRSYNALLRVCARTGEWQRARTHFDKMAHHDIPADTGTFNALMKACLRGNALKEALDIFEWMISGREINSIVPADTETYNTLIKACHQAGLLEKALEIGTWLMATSAATGVDYDHTTMNELIATVEVAQIWDQKAVNTAWITQKGTATDHEGRQGRGASGEGVDSNEGMVPLAVFPAHLRPAPHEPMRFQYMEHVRELDEEAFLAAVKLGQPSWASALTRGSHAFSPKGPPQAQGAAGELKSLFSSQPATPAWSSPKLPKIAPTRTPVILSRAPSFRNMSIENAHSRYLALPGTPSNNNYSPRPLNTDGSRQAVGPELASPKKKGQAAPSSEGSIGLPCAFVASCPVLSQLQR